MRKSTIYLNLALVLAIGLFVIGFILPENSQLNSDGSKFVTIKGNKTAQLIFQNRQFSAQKEISLFTPQTKEQNAAVMQKYVSDASFMSLDRNVLLNILTEKAQNIILSIPGGSTVVELELTKVNIQSDNFRLYNNVTKSYEAANNDGVYYQGIIKGDNNSIASVSFFDTFVMGVIANADGNYVLGSVKDDNHNFTSNYVYYNDKNLLNHTPFKCGDEGREDDMVLKNRISSKNNGNIRSEGDVSPRDSINVYFDTDHAMFVDLGGNADLVSQYVRGFFNSVRTIYFNEDITVGISGIGYWQSASPYDTMNDSYNILAAFGANQKDNFQGDLAHLLSTGHSGQLGGIAWIDVLCQPYSVQQGTTVGRYAFSNIETTYLPWPTYSWTVTVMTHEMGHNLGSYHTHACHWRLPNGGIGPLDSCIVTQENASPSFGGQGCINATPQNACYQTNNPAVNGFIMSYCHFCANNGGGINLNNGFGRPFGTFWAQSGDTIRAKYQNAKCLGLNMNSSETPATFVLMQNFPNPYNPTTNLSFALPVGGSVKLTVYDITGREVARLLNGQSYPIGIFNYTFDANVYNLASGVYLYRLEVSSEGKTAFTQIKKMVLVK